MSAAEAERLHDQAMAAADAGRWNIAASTESRAWLACPGDLQPSKAILARSAAALYLRAGFPRLAAGLARHALRDAPPTIAAELREVLAEAERQP